MSQPNHDSNGSDSSGQNSNVAMFLVRAWATSIEVFIRADFGTRYLGLQAAAVFLLVPTYCGIKRTADAGMMSLYLVNYLVLCCLHRQTIRRRTRRGVFFHSYYDGTPMLWKLFPWCSEVPFKRYVEPVLVMAIGVLLIPVSEPCGLYLLIGGVCMGLATGACCARQEVQLLDLNDSILDQQALAERLREMRGDRH